MDNITETDKVKIDNSALDREQMDIVIIGHVDHGKSTVIGRLLADTGSLPEGKLESVKEYCRKNSRPFEYAFLLDALKDEQAQGITIDSARCFFKTAKRDYIIIDAPGHIEFLKNMISGAARAEAALLVIDAKEGIKENSRRHGYLLSLLGIRKLSVLINKMDLIDYDEVRYNSLVEEYSAFLHEIGVEPVSFIPVSALSGENITAPSEMIGWYKGGTVLEQLDRFEREKEKVDKPFRLPVQDIYKFTKDGDDRRIVAGLVETGTIGRGEEVIFYPSGKKSHIKSIEYFNREQFEEVGAGYTPGFTLTDQIYIKAGEVMCRAVDEPMEVSNRFKANIFWMSKAPMIKNKSYKLKLASTRAVAELGEIINIVDASDLTTDSSKEQIDQFDTAECVIETAKPLAFDRYSDFAATGRFVLIDNYEIVGGGIIVDSLGQEHKGLKDRVEQRDITWDRGLITAADRESRWNHKPKFILFTGASSSEQAIYAKELESWLFKRGYFVYYLGITSIDSGLDADLKRGDILDREEQVRRLGELAKMFTAAGMIFITTINEADRYDLETLKLLNSPNEIIVVNNWENSLSDEDVDLTITGEESTGELIENIVGLLVKKDVVSEYYI